MPLLRGEGVVLRSMNLGEWDRLLVVLTVGLGKIKVVAKGARKVQSRYASITQPFSYLRFTSYRGKTFHTLSQVEVIEGYRPLRDNLEKIAYGLYLMELVDLSLVEEQAHDDILSLLLASLHILCHSERYELLLAFFELRLLSRLGFALDLRQCAECGGQAGHRLRLNAGGLLCDRCSQEGAAHGAVTVSSEALRLLAALRQNDWQKIETMPKTPVGEREMAALLDRIVSHRIEKTPESFKFLAEIRRGSR